MVMIRFPAALFAACISLPAATGAQTPESWNDERALELVRRATERRAAQLADTGLVDYSARAHGYLTFLAQLGDGFPEPPRVLKADELELEVYWRAPNLSKQRIVGRRDTLLLPTDINYHRDHLGIVQNNFPGIIRLGDGDEVQDVPHPLSATGQNEYDFAITDSLTLNLGNRELAVYEVRFRPRNDQLPRAVGALYLDRAEGQVARMTLGFTRSALRDKQLEDVSVALDNGLVDGRFWLPRRQSIEIRRTGSWMDFPVRGVIRGRWEICCVEVNKGLDPALFVGPEIVAAPASVLRAHRWEGRIVDSLPPDITAVREEDIRKVQTDARALVRSQALERLRSGSVSARRVSDLVRVNRVEGLALGLGLRQRLGNGFSVGLRGRYGTRDKQGKGSLELRREMTSGGAVTASLYHEFREAGDVPETSALKNSIAAQEFGSDFSDPFDVRGYELRIDLVGPASLRWFASYAYERQAPLAIHATPARGSYEATLPAWRSTEDRVEFGVSRPLRSVREGPTQFEGSAVFRVAGNTSRGEVPKRVDGFYSRITLRGRMERPGSAGKLVISGHAAALQWWEPIIRLDDPLDTPARGGSDLPPQLLVHIGGPVTGPGYGFHEFSGWGGGAGRVEWQLPVPFFRVPLGRFGRTSNRAVLAPFAHSLFIVGPGGTGPTESYLGARPSLGVGLLTFFEVLRLDIARGLRGGRWTFSADVSTAFWGIL
jgi:hypothetical protein